MRIKGMTDEDFVNYKKPSMFIASPSCTFKCDKENGCQLCQNMPLASVLATEVDPEALIERYLSNEITKAIVFGGLEPFDTFLETVSFIDLLRKRHRCNDDVVIYTGYDPEEIADELDILRKYPNIIVKYGRFRPDCGSHYDSVLGVRLASANQYAERIS